MKFENFQPYFSCKDHLVSGEKFDLLYNQEFDLLITSPKPKEEKLSEYYKSENYISHTDSNKTIFEKAYQWVKSIMLKKKISLIEKYHNNQGSILDIGAGTGDFLKTIKNHHWKTQGVEPNKNAREIAKRKEISLQQETSSFGDGEFDVISMWHVLEHVPNLEAQLKELERLLKKEGTLFVAVPNFKSYDAKHYKEFWAAYDVPRHLWHFSKFSISKLFNTIGFELVEIIPMKFDAYYVSLLSEKNKHSGQHYLKGIFNGFRSNMKAKASKEYSSHIYVLKRKQNLI